MSFRILHIEDSELQICAVRSLLAKALKSEDYVYKSCKSLEEAKELMNQGCLDIILVDLNLPDSQGANSIAAVRKICPDVPIIVLTGTDDIKTAKAAIHAGASTYVLKSDISALPLITILTVEKWEIEKQLKNRCQLYDSIVNISPDYICRFKVDGIITFINQSFSDLIGKREIDVIGTSIVDYLDTETQQRFMSMNRSLVDRCSIADSYDSILNGRWISWRASAIRDLSGAVKEIQCVGRDTTYKHRRTQELLALAQDDIGIKQRQINERVDVAFATLFETDKMLSAMEGG